jgi:hypothetical protein
MTLLTKTDHENALKILKESEVGVGDKIFYKDWPEANYMGYYEITEIDILNRKVKTEESGNDRRPDIRTFSFAAFTDFKGWYRVTDKKVSLIELDPKYENMFE